METTLPTTALPSRWTPLTELPERLTVEEFAAAAGLSRASAYDLARRGVVPTIRFGKRIFIPKTALRQEL